MKAGTAWGLGVIFLLMFGPTLGLLGIGALLLIERAVR